jgi:hypothetical protein
MRTEHLTEVREMRLMERLENIFAATAFAEEGELDTAREFMKGDGKDVKHDTVCAGNDCLTQPPLKVA